MAKNRLVAILLQRCPVCLEGEVFRSFLGTHRCCPRCGIRYERESGYYLNAMFIAYVFGFLILAPESLYLYLRGASAELFLGVILLTVLLLWSFIFRYSRVVWLHLDQMMDPRSSEVDREDSGQWR